MQYNRRDLLRFTTAGSVDDGKSTLIGRLLYDSKSIFEDQLNSVERCSQKKGLNHLDLSLFTDGLKDEREQGITIDVAYRYFSTPKRKFIIADSPGHIQYTRNMVTGASTANLALILVDARKGVVEQTKRHAFIASLLQIQHIIVCVNKMDLVGYSEDVFEEVVEQYEAFSSKMVSKDVRYIPISALHGDNVVSKSQQMVWYQGRSLLNSLENIHISSDYNFIDMRFPVQTVIRPNSTEYHDYRAYAGRVASGILRVGDEVNVLPSGERSKIESIHSYDGELKEAFPPMSVSIILDDKIDVSRGDVLVKINNQPQMIQEVDVMICWFNNKPANSNTKFILRQTSTEVNAIIKEIIYKIDINTLQRNTKDKELFMNDIARVKLRTTRPLILDQYRDNRSTGSIILIDPVTNETVAAGMVN